ncbi:DUF4145 domain-containing protein [Mesorhizobium sp. M1227]|uniref:DUF4145 domain-containing protein n=1 Tax=unclassified Mesorhizobium TaxID=325217 RepID=UPI003334D8EF
MAAILRWINALTLTSRAYTCGHCGNPVASNVGYVRGSYQDGSGSPDAFVYICHHCYAPSYFGQQGQVPGIRFGADVKGIDEATVQQLYDEARDCFSKNAFTAAVLCCRKLLMHIAVSKGADKNKNFMEYVEFISAKGYVPPDAKTWVDHIRTKGNEANHEIVVMSEEEATDLLAFVEMLLKLVFEFPSASKKYSLAPRP